MEKNETKNSFVDFSVQEEKVPQTRLSPSSRCAVCVCLYGAGKRKNKKKREKTTEIWLI